MTSADHRAAYLYAVEPELITMMQQCASGAKLRTAGPFFRKVHRPCCSSGPAASDYQNSVDYSATRSDRRMFLTMSRPQRVM
jgi:hypothetical protein